MRHYATILLISAVVIALLVAGCTTQPQTAPVTPLPTTMPVTTPGQPSIIGTWSLVSTYSGGRAVSALSGTTITATFSDGGTVSGSAGCNNYVATYQIGRENAITIGKLATAKTICDYPTGIMDQETIYLQNLQGATSYAINGNTLNISDSMGKTVLTYQRSGSLVTTLPIAGITWNLDHYRNVSESDVHVIKGTEVTALFGPIANITGSSGCNTYKGGYTTSGINGISIGPVATTLMYCGDPGVMDQETAYLALLNRVASYEMTADGMLNLKTSTGTPVLVYTS